MSDNFLVKLLAIKNSLFLSFTTILLFGPLPRNICEFYEKYLVLLGTDGLLIRTLLNHLVTNGIAECSLDRPSRLICATTKLTLPYNACLASFSLLCLDSAALVATLS